MDEKKPKILLVEDIKANVRLLEKHLCHEYETISAFDGKTGIDKAIQYLPDLILLDILLPDIDGFDVCRHLKSNSKTRHIPIIFLTTLNEMEDETKGLELGAVDYLIKPFRIPIIKARIKNHIELKQTRDLLESLASIDGLTGIPNRRKFDLTIENEWNRATREHRPLSLVLMDIDFFKRYNDEYGHAMGDDCLKKVARTIQKSLNRASDFAARYGGEEFAVILPNCDLENSVQTAQIIRKSVCNLNIPHAQSPTADYLTLSLGAASFHPQKKDKPLTIINAADEALYKAKGSGRNSVGTCHFPL